MSGAYFSATGSKAEWLAALEANRKADALSAAAPELLEALLPFVDLKAQTGAHGVISKALDGMAPLTVTVTKAQMLAAWNAVQKARGA